jgi:hypothetical protein
MAITQEDCISAHKAEKKRKTPTGSSATQPARYRLVQNAATRAPPRSNMPGRWVARPPQQARFNRPPTPPFQQQQQQGPAAEFFASKPRKQQLSLFQLRKPVPLHQGLPST